MDMVSDGSPPRCCFTVPQNVIITLCFQTYGSVPPVSWIYVGLICLLNVSMDCDRVFLLHHFSYLALLGDLTYFAVI